MKNLKDVPQFPWANYHVTQSWLGIDDFFANCVRVNLDPDYQRGYVWSQFQKESYVEYLLRGGRSGRDIQFNCPNWHTPIGDTEWHDTLELVDGKQRLNAIREFLSNKVKVFGKYLNEYEDGNRIGRVTYHLDFHVNNLATKKEVIEWYLGMNTGGSIHTKEDLKSAYESLSNL